LVIGVIIKLPGEDHVSTIMAAHPVVHAKTDEKFLLTIRKELQNNTSRHVAKPRPGTRDRTVQHNICFKACERATLRSSADGVVSFENQLVFFLAVYTG